MTSWPPPALVLTAGLATRLRPLSDLRAKAALPVAGETLVRRILGRLHAQGLRDIVLNLHHQPDTIARLVGDGDDLGLRVRYSWEPRLLGSAGGPRHALQLLDADRFFVINGDTLNGIDLRDMWETHARRGARVSMALVPSPPAGKYGGVELDTAERVIAFRRATAGGPGFTSSSIHHFIGVQVTDRSVFEHLPDNVPAESVREVYPALLDDRPHAVWGYRGSPEFHDIGTPADYLRTSLALAATLPQPGAALTGIDSVVAADARVERTVLWDRVVVGAGATLVDVVATDDVVVPAGATFERCVIMRREDAPPDVAVSIVGRLAVVGL